jgi:hypothetical protein
MMCHQHVAVSVKKGSTLKVQKHIIAIFLKTKAHTGSSEYFVVTKDK